LPVPLYAFSTNFWVQNPVQLMFCIWLTYFFLSWSFSKKIYTSLNYSICACDKSIASNITQKRLLCLTCPENIQLIIEWLYCIDRLRNVQNAYWCRKLWPGRILKNILTWLSENKATSRICKLILARIVIIKRFHYACPLSGWLKLARLRKFRPKFDLENVGLI
jgi:hypothetical protein